MKMVRSLLLGTAAGFVAVAGAQAADMPVKAKPVQYVKICTLYGDGFYYIPGTDICLKIGGYVRAEYTYNYGPSMTNGPFANVSGYQTRTDGQDFTMRSRAYAWFDSRQQTEYGTLRTYLQLGLNFDSPNGNAFNGNRAFIQFAGFTAGLAQSFYDFYSSPATSYFGPPSSDTGDPGWKVFAYTANFGNGLSSTVSIEEPRSFGTASAPAGGIINTNFTGNIFTVSNAGPALVVSDKAKARFPDLVSNWRIDQAWGAAQIMFAAHDASAGYYGTTLTGAEINGHPADKLGWAAAAGAKFNLPGGDTVGFNFVYGEGATGFVANATANSQIYNASTSVGVGWLSDGIFANGTEVELTKAWGVTAAYEHKWNSRWRTSLYGGYVNIDYNDTATGIINSALAAGSVCARPFAGLIGNLAVVTALAGNSCNPDFSFYQVGSRTQFNPVPQLDIGLDVLYTGLNTAYKGPGTYAANGSRPAITLFDNQGVWSALVRWQRNFYP